MILPLLFLNFIILLGVYLAINNYVDAIFMPAAYIALVSGILLSKV